MHAGHLVLAIGCATLLAGCTSDAPASPASIALSLLAPKGLLDVDNVKLYVFDQGTVPCAKSTIGVPPTSVDRVFELSLAKCSPTGKQAWCGSGSLEKNPDRLLTFYVEGRFAAKTGGFTGCTEHAIDQDPVQIAITAQPLVEGVKCGDVQLGLGETCDPGSSVNDEACDGSKCQTKEVVLSNGKAANHFFRGLAGRKTGLSVHWTSDGHFFGVWSDRATGFGGADASDEITVRRISAELLSESTPLVLSTEVRLPPPGSGANGDGTKRRSGVNMWPSFVPVSAGDWLAVWVREGRINGSLQKGNLGSPAADFEIAPGGGTQDLPHAASSPAGDAVTAYVEGSAVKSVLRKADGTLSAPVSLGTVAAPASENRPKVAWAGGDWIVVWGEGGDIKLQRLGADGSAKGAAIVANAAKAAGTQSEPDVAAFDSGDALVVWKDGQGDVGADIRGQRFDKSGAPTGTEIASVLNDQVKDADQDQPVVTAGTNGSGKRFYLVAWRNAPKQAIAARFVSAEGGFLVSYLGATSSEFTASADARPRSSPAVAISDPSKGYCAIAWADDADGDAAGDDDRVRVRRVPMPQ